MMRQLLIFALPLVLAGLTGCAGAPGGGGGTFGPPMAQLGQSCNPASDGETCLGAARLRCDPAASQWLLVESCAPPTSCLAVMVAGSQTAWASACSASATPQDGGRTAQDATSIKDAGRAGGTDSGPKDAGRVLDTGVKDTAPQDTAPQDAGGGKIDTAPVVAGQPPPAIAVQGGFTGYIDGKTWKVDYGPGPHYGGMQVSVGFAHKKTNKSTTCTTTAALSLARHDGSCKLQLIWEADGNGKLKLAKAAFHARALNYGDNDYAPGQYPCMGWTNEPGSGQVVYELTNSNATLDFGGPLQQPWAGQSQAVIDGLVVKPMGSVQMAFNGRTFNLVFDGLRFQGAITSQGNPSAMCPGDYQPIPNVTLKDINPKSPSYGKMVNTNSFKGKRVAILMGAGWCASCVAQVEYMQTVKEQLEAQGKTDFQMLAMNVSSANSSGYHAAITGKKKKATFPVLQSTSSSNGWGVFNGKKNDAFIYFANGKLAFKHVGKSVVNLTQFKNDLHYGLTAQPPN